MVKHHKPLEGIRRSLLGDKDCGVSGTQLIRDYVDPQSIPMCNPIPHVAAVRHLD
jgi:hypothetical protein